MKLKNIIEPRIRRGLAARLLNLHPKTLRIRERQGKLTPIHENSRMVFYLVSEVEKLKRGEVATPEPDRPLIPAVCQGRRCASGSFHCNRARRRCAGSGLTRSARGNRRNSR